MKSPEEKQLTPGQGLPAPICSPLIECRMRSVSGHFDMRSGKLVAVKRRKYGAVELCFAEGWNIPFAEIKLHDTDRAKDADAVFDAACRLGDEICRRWNLHLENTQEVAGEALPPSFCSPGSNHRKPTE